MSTHCCASAFHACPVAQDIDASLLWLSHPSAEANGAERTRANSDAVRVFIAFSLFFIEIKYPEIVFNQGTQCLSVLMRCLMHQQKRARHKGPATRVVHLTWWEPGQTNVKRKNVNSSESGSEIKSISFIVRLVRQPSEPFTGVDQ